MDEPENHDTNTNVSTNKDTTISLQQEESFLQLEQVKASPMPFVPLVTAADLSLLEDELASDLTGRHVIDMLDNCLANDKVDNGLENDVSIER